MTIENPMLRYFVPGSYSFMKPELVAAHGRRFPLMLNIEPTLACNLRCYMCPSHNGSVGDDAKRATGMMDWGLFTRLMDECAAEGSVLVLNMHKDGESMLHPRFLDMIAYAKAARAAEIVHFNTNATFTKPDTIDRLFDSGVDDITISIDAYWPETFKRVKGKDLLAVVNANAERMFERRAQRNLDRPYMRVKMLGAPELEAEFALFQERWKGIADEVQVQRIHNFAGGLDFVEAPEGERYPCAFPFYSTAVNWDGTVTICHRDYNNIDVLGDVTTQSLKEVYVGTVYRRYLEALRDGREGDLPVCGGCDNWAHGPRLDGDVVDELTTQADGPAGRPAPVGEANR